MFDCHVHTGISPVHLDYRARRADRDRFADWLREQGERFGIDRFCGIVQILGSDVAECRKHNRLMGRLVRENPDILHGWGRINPAWEDAAVEEFRRAIEEDGLLGLKLMMEVKCDDPRVHQLAETAIERDVPVKIHTMQRVERREELPNESTSDNVRALAEAYPDLKILASHIGGGGDWQYRIKNISEQENVWLDLSGSVADAGMVEMAAEYLGTERLVFGTDNSMHTCVGKLEGAELDPEQKAHIAYNMASLLREDDPYGYDDEELAELIADAKARFRAVGDDRVDRDIVDVNAFVGRWPFRPVDGAAGAVLERMDTHGVDRALVSSTESVMYRNPQDGNQQLAESIAGHEDRLVPVATINPTYAAWRDDLTHCIEDLGMCGVKLLPAYHDYDLDEPAVTAVANRCGELDVPVLLVATIEDQRHRHPRVQLRDWEDFRGKPKHWRDTQVEDLIALLNAAPRTDFVIADAWQDCYRIKTETLYERRAMVNDPAEAGDLLFVLGDLFLDYPGQREKVAEQLGVEHLVCGPQLPFRVFDSHYVARYLPISEGDRDRIRAGTVRDVLG